MYQERIIAVPPSPIAWLGHALNRVWPVEERPCFERLVGAINIADRELWEERAVAL